MVNDKYKNGDYTTPPFGMFGYDENNSDKPKKNTVAAKPVVDETLPVEDETFEIESLPPKTEINTEPPKAAVEKKNEVSPQVSTNQNSFSNFWSKIKGAVSRPAQTKPAQMQTKKETPVTKPVSDNKNPVQDNVDMGVKWKVPENTRKVIVQICEPNGRLINEYTISDFIKLTPGQILKVKAE